VAKFLSPRRRHRSAAWEASELIEEKLVMSYRPRADRRNSLNTKDLPIARSRVAPIGWEKNTGELALFALLLTDMPSNPRALFGGKFSALQAIFTKK
jgi:hypothetical protein